MPVFTFSGKDANGQKISGERMAPNKQTLAQSLRRERITPGAIREKGKEFSLPTFGSGKVSTKDIAVFFRQFSVMIDADTTKAAAIAMRRIRKMRKKRWEDIASIVPAKRSAEPGPITTGFCRFGWSG